MDRIKKIVITWLLNIFFKTFSKSLKSKKIQKKHVFNTFRPFACICFFVVLNYFFLVVFSRKLNSKKYIFNAFVSILYFLIAFLIKLTLTLFSLKNYKNKMRKNKERNGQGTKMKKGKVSDQNKMNFLGDHVIKK